MARRRRGGSPGETLCGNAELVAFRVLQHRPAMLRTGNKVPSNDSGAERDESFDRRWIRIDEVEVHTVLRSLGLRNLLEVPRGFAPIGVAASEGGESGVTSRVEGSVQDR